MVKKSWQNGYFNLKKLVILAWPKHLQYNILEIRPIECLVIYEQLIKIEAVRSHRSDLLADVVHQP